MKLSRILPVVLIMLIAPSLYAHGSEAQQNGVGVFAGTKAAPQMPGVPIKVQVVISEYDGSEKIGSLPYSFYMLAARATNVPAERMRFSTSGPGNTPLAHVDASIDCRAVALEAGKYSLSLSVSRNSTLMFGEDGKVITPGGDESRARAAMQDFSQDFTVVMRDGEKIEGASATDPATGHVIKIEVTLNVVK